ncbi:MAG: KTSC domain-containing protein [Mesorhizobium sp.]|nr:MAG: KTSC domain-containing protein [Mesorhizobium sp.]
MWRSSNYRHRTQRGETSQARAEPRCGRYGVHLDTQTEYDPERRTLSAWFVASGKCYQFEDVPPETYAAFKAAIVNAATSRPPPQSLPIRCGYDRRRCRMTSYGPSASFRLVATLCSGRRLVRRPRQTIANGFLGSLCRRFNNFADLAC